MDEGECIISSKQSYQLFKKGLQNCLKTVHLKNIFLLRQGVAFMRLLRKSKTQETLYQQCYHSKARHPFLFDLLENAII
jgi:hypothetical protein